MKIKNLTPHDIRIKPFNAAAPENKLDLVIKPSGKVARVNMEYDTNNEYQLVDFGRTSGNAPLLAIATVKAKYGELIGLPEPQDDMMYIVSAMVAQAVPERNDVYAPDTGDTAVRDKDGNILRVTRLIQYSNPYADRVIEIEQEMIDDKDAEMRHAEYRQQKEAERVHYANLANESEERERQYLIEKNMDLQDEIDNKDHVWGTHK